MFHCKCRTMLQTLPGFALNYVLLNRSSLITCVMDQFAYLKCGNFLGEVISLEERSEFKPCLENRRDSPNNCNGI